MGCLGWIFTILEWAFYAVVLIGVIMVVAGACGAFGAVSYSDAAVTQQAGQGCSVGFFVGLAFFIVLLKARR